MKKKRLSEEISISHLCFTNEIRGDRYTIHAKWKGVGGQVRVHGGRGRGGLAPPLEIGKKEAVRGNFNLFHLYFTTFLI